MRNYPTSDILDNIKFSAYVQKASALLLVVASLTLVNDAVAAEARDAECSALILF